MQGEINNTVVLEADRNEKNHNGTSVIDDNRYFMAFILVFIMLSSAGITTAVILQKRKDAKYAASSSQYPLNNDDSFYDITTIDKDKETTTPPVPTYKLPKQRGCVWNRLDNEDNSYNNNNRVYTEQYVCSKDEHRYMWGLNSFGDLVWIDTIDNVTKTYYKNPIQISTSSTEKKKILDYYFTLTIDGTFVIHRVEEKENVNNETSSIITVKNDGGDDSNDHGDNKLVEVDEILQWKLKPNYEIDLYKKCLTANERIHDCPYLHLHTGRGVMVLAWIDFSLSSDDWGWMEENIKRCYDFNTTDIL